MSWRVYKFSYAKPIDQELVIDIDFSVLSSKSAKDIETLYLFCKEGWVKSVIGEYHTQKQALSRFFLGAMILSEPVLQVIRRELKRVSPDLRVEIEELKQAISSEVLKREVLEGDKATEARQRSVGQARSNFALALQKTEDVSTPDEAPTEEANDATDESATQE